MNSEIEIIEEGRQWMVIDKPPGLPVHRTATDEPDLLSLLSPPSGKGLHIVNRLDRDTGGLVLLAKTPAVAAELMALWNTDKVEKNYVARARGGKPSWSETAWTFQLSDRGEGHDRPQGPRDLWKDCRTEVKYLGSLQQDILFSATLKTGRKHQIRRHALMAGYPLRGDKRYGSAKKGPLCLHAVELKINWKGLPLEWTSRPPDWSVGFQPV